MKCSLGPFKSRLADPGLCVAVALEPMSLRAEEETGHGSVLALDGSSFGRQTGR